MSLDMSLELAQELLQEKAERTPQKEYRPSPFRESAWENVGERLKNLNFISMEVPVQTSREAPPDSMFENFGSGVAHGKVVFHHMPKGEKAFLETDELEVFQREKQEDELRFSAFIDILRKEVADVCENMERQAFQLALSVSKRILSTTAEARPDYILEVIRKGLQATGAARPLEVRVSPDDAEFLHVVGLPANFLNEDQNLKITADETIQSGCIIITDFGEIDVQLDSMWEQVRETLFSKMES
jgi:hypothetical protein